MFTINESWKKMNQLKRASFSSVGGGTALSKGFVNFSQRIFSHFSPFLQRMKAIFAVGFWIVHAQWECQEVIAWMAFQLVFDTAANSVDGQRSRKTRRRPRMLSPFGHGFPQFFPPFFPVLSPRLSLVRMMCPKFLIKMIR
jgi:hypothetical protein